MGLVSALQYVDNWETERYELLNTRVCDLSLNLAETPLRRCIERLYAELAGKKIQFRPPYYFTCGGDEWGAPIEYRLSESRFTSPTTNSRALSARWATPPTINRT